MLESDDYQLNPEFQRRHRWDDAKKSKLIESFIMNVPIPPIFLYEDRFSHYEVMDGLQRLTAIKTFYNDKFSLEGLEEWAELNGRKYSNLPDQVRRGIDRRYLSSIILLQETAKTPREAQRLKQLVFERINSGGVKLEPQEARNAIYNGPLNQLCIKLARDWIASGGRTSRTLVPSSCRSGAMTMPRSSPARSITASRSAEVISGKSTGMTITARAWCRSAPTARPA